ncbi:MAG: glucuronate isomerase [Clostridia bacterium]
MKKFIGKDFLLTNSCSIKIYNAIQNLPIIDYHCHLEAKDIYENTPFTSLTDAWLSGDHYKWRAMRYMGIDEALITGSDTLDYDKFVAWATVLPVLAGNPLYHFSHLELKRYFNINEPLTPENAEHIYKLAGDKLKTLTPRKIIEQSGVELIATTNDPMESLDYHKLLALDTTFKVKVLPAFRPDKFLNIEKSDFVNYIKTAAETANKEIIDINDIKDLLIERLNHFTALGAFASDHGLEWIPFVADNKTIAALAAKKAIKGEPLSRLEIDSYKTHLLQFLAAEYKKRDIVMEIHFGTARDNSDTAHRTLGADSGFDSMHSRTGSDNIVSLLNSIERLGNLPKTLLFSLNPADNPIIVSAAGSFQAAGIKGRVQQGAAWWLNDHFHGMDEHLKNYAALAPLDSFVGMLTDSRSFLSYTRHEYFRRILADYLGKLLYNGEYADIDYLIKIAKNIAYYNAAEYFELKNKA